MKGTTAAGILWGLILFSRPSLAATAPLDVAMVGCRTLLSARVRVGLHVSTNELPLLAPELRRTVEAAWSPYGVAIDWSTEPVNAIPLRVDLVMLVRHEPIATAPHALGAVVFGPDGPGRIIRLSIGTAIERVQQGQPIQQSISRALRGMTTVQLDDGAARVGRVLGHAAAHELGHVLLSSKVHARSGLMAAVYTVRREPDSQSTQLDDLNRRRLAGILRRAAPCQQGVE